MHIVVAAQAGRVDPRPRQRGPRTRVERDRTVGMPIDVAIEAGRTSHRLLGDPMLGLIEPGCRKLDDQEPQALELLGSEDPLEQLAKVGLGDFMPARDVAQVRAHGEEQGERELGQVRLGDVEFDVKAPMFGVRLDPHRGKSW